MLRRVPLRGHHRSDTDVTIEHETTIEVGGRQVTILPLGPAHTAGDAAVFIPDAGVLFAGDLLFIGGTPIMWAGPVASWIAACDRMTALQPSVVVPGHEPVTDATGIAEVRSYLAYVDNQAREAFDAGKSWDKAALEMDLGPYAPLPDSERVVVTTYNIYRDLQSDLPARTVAELFTLMAEWQAARVD